MRILFFAIFLALINLQSSFSASGLSSDQDVKVNKPTPQELEKKYRLRARIKAFREKLIYGPNLSSKEKKKIEIKGVPDELLSRDEDKEQKKSLAKELSSTQAIINPGLGWYYQNQPFYFGGNSYVNNMDTYVYTYYAEDISAESMQVDFSFIDLESGWDRVQLWDYYGLCASYSGSYRAFTSATCRGNYVKIYVHTDSSNSGASYDGFYIAGVRYYINPPNTPPVAVARASTYSIKTGDTVYFYGYDSYDTDTNDPLSYSWSFGDGLTSNFDNPNHTYTEPGTYLIALTVRDRENGIDKDFFTITVSEDPPTAEFEVDSTIINSELPAVVYPQAKNADAIVIDWGDGITTISNNFVPSTSFSHYYAREGRYNVVLKATNTGGSSTSFKVLTVTGDLQKPQLGLEFKTRNDVGYRLDTRYKIRDDGNIETMRIVYGTAPLLSPAKRLNMNSFEKENGIYTVKQSYNFNQKVNNFIRPLAGEYTVKASVTDNQKQVTTLSFLFRTKNTAPAINPLGFKKSCTSLRCVFRFGSKNDPMSNYLSDFDGSISQTIWRVYTSSKVLYKNCPARYNKDYITCTFDRPGNYIVNLKVIDNLGLYKYFVHRFEVKNLKTKTSAVGFVPSASKAEVKSSALQSVAQEELTQVAESVAPEENPAPLPVDVNATINMNFGDINDKIVEAFDKELGRLYAGDCSRYGTAADRRSPKRRYRCGEVPVGNVQYKTSPLANGSRDRTNQTASKFLFNITIPAMDKKIGKYNVKSQAVTIPFTIGRGQLNTKANTSDLSSRGMKLITTSRLLGQDIYLRHIPQGDELKTLVCMNLPGLKVSSPSVLMHLKAKKKEFIGSSKATIVAAISPSFYSFGSLQICSEIRTTLSVKTLSNGTKKYTPVVKLVVINKPKILNPQFKGLIVADVDAKVHGFYGFIGSVVNLVGKDIEEEIEKSAQDILQKELSKKVDVTQNDIKSGRWLTSYVQDFIGSEFGFEKVNASLVKAFDKDGPGQALRLGEEIYDMCADSLLANVPQPTSQQRAEALATCQQMIVSFNVTPFFNDAKMRSMGCYSYYSYARNKTAWWRKKCAVGSNLNLKVEPSAAELIQRLIAQYAQQF